METRTIQTTLIALFFSFSAIAQFQLSGKVQNQEGIPIEGASISVKGENLGAYTDSTGRYAISPIKKGNYEIEVSAFDYETQIRQLELHEDVELNFSLELQFLLQEEVDVIGVRATKNTPTTYTNLTVGEIEKRNFGQDIPYILSSVPSTIASSDAGAGIGYTNFRIRGVDPTRTNVTIDGIPYNDAETQAVFWVNLPDFSTSAESIQIQRGVGTSTNGSSAFGASINISTDKIHSVPYLISDNTFGSFNSFKNSLSFGSGLINEKFTVDARLSSIVSDGYIDRSSSNLKSFFISTAYHGKKSTLKLNVFAGKEKTYQAWYGTPESRLLNDEEEILNYAIRNGLNEEETDNLLNSGRTYNFYSYDNETDNYQQSHYHLHYTYRFNTSWNAKIAAHYTRGKGYFENYYRDDTFSTFNFPEVIVNEDTIRQMDLIRQKWLDNHFFGGVFNINYTNHKGLELILGGGVNNYLGDHYDRVVWGEHLTDEQRKARYFENNSDKLDGNVYFKTNYQIKKFILFADLQYRYIDYTFVGIDELYGSLFDLSQQVVYHFFNPKAGISYRINQHHFLYASYAIANREPVRDDFREKTVANRPSSERLYNLEAGYHFTQKNGFFKGNIFHMLYDNQLVLTGEINDVGGYTRSNVKESFRYGLELEGGIIAWEKLRLSANLSLSQNKIKNFVEYVDAFDEDWNLLPQEKIEYGKTDLAFSPNIIGGLTVDYTPFKGFSFGIESKYVGKQFLDNTSTDSRSLDPYFIGNFDVSYSFSPWKIKELTIGGRINNLWNTMYANNGYTFSYLVGSDRIQENFYYPQAGIHFMIRLMIKL